MNRIISYIEYSFDLKDKMELFAFMKEASIAYSDNKNKRERCLSNRLLEYVIDCPNFVAKISTTLAPRFSMNDSLKSRY